MSVNFKKLTNITIGAYNFWGTGDFNEHELDHFAETMNRLNKRFDLVHRQIDKKAKDPYEAQYMHCVLDIFATKYQNNIFENFKPKAYLKAHFDTLDSFLRQTDNLAQISAKWLYEAVSDQWKCFTKHYAKTFAKEKKKVKPTQHELMQHYAWKWANKTKDKIIDNFWQLQNIKKKEDIDKIILK